MLKAPTFARPPTPAPSGAAAPSVVQTLANPWVGGAAAGMFFFAAAAALILIVGDPHAGAPRVRISLDKPRQGSAAPGDLRSRLSDPAQALTPGQPGGEAALIDPAAAEASAGDVSGQAVITLPQGGTIGGSLGPGAAPAPTRASTASPLDPAPIAGLWSASATGPLPIIGKDGRTPFQAYARPFHDNGKPKVALIIGGLGLNAAATRAAIDRLPPEVTLSFVPYADGLQGWIDAARAGGHEVLLEIPMEPLDYPNNDPGPSTLMATSSKEDLSKRLDWLLSRATGYFGVTNYLGGRFVTVETAMSQFTSALKARGLGFLDDGSALHRGQTGLPRASADSIVDEQLSADAIRGQLNDLAANAAKNGRSLGAGFAYPVTLSEVSKWAQGLAARGCQLAPASALARK